MYQEIILAVIVSLDTCLAAAAYCNSGIKIPPLSALVINIICSSVLWISIKFSGIISIYIPPDICKVLGTAVMTIMGLFTILKSLVRTLTRLLSESGEMSVKMKGAGIVVKLYLDDTAADFDNSKILSPVEAAALAAASSLDSAAAGMSCGFSINPELAALFSFITGFAALIIGSVAGRKISSLNHDFSWVGGIMIIIFAFFSF